MLQTEKILAEINPIFRDILENDDLIITSESTSNDIENWDSITNIQIIVAIEKHYKIRFTSREIQNFKNVGELCHAVLSKINA